MQIAPLSAMGLTNQSLTPNTTYNSAQAAAESSQFATMLKDLKEKAAKLENMEMDSSVAEGGG